MSITKRKILLTILTILLISSLNIQVKAEELTAEYYYNQGNNYSENLLFNIACDNYKKAINKNPNYVEAYFMLGNAYKSQEILELAIQNYEKAISIKPNYAKAYLEIADTYAKNGNYPLAVTYLSKAVKIDNNNTHSLICKKILKKYFEFAQTDINNKNFDEAEEKIQKIIEILPNFEAAHLCLGAVYLCKMDYDSLYQVLNTILKINPKSYNAYFLLGEGKLHQKKYDEAIEAFNKAKELNSAFHSAYFGLASVYLQNGNYNEATQNLNIAIKLNPNALNYKTLLKYVEDKSLIIQNKKITDKQPGIIVPKVKAPDELYNLVSLNSKIKEGALAKSYEFLDILWGDPDGQKLLEIVKNYKIPVNITQGSAITEVQTKTYANLGIFGWRDRSLIDKNRDIKINIGENFIFGVNNISLNSYQRIISIETFVHELCHAVVNAKDNTHKNALQEEISATMIGLNVAYRIMYGRELTENETVNYSKSFLRGALMDEHRSLPIYNDFNIRIAEIGIHQSHLAKYANIVEVYKTIREDPSTKTLPELEEKIKE